MCVRIPTPAWVIQKNRSMNFYFIGLVPMFSLQISAVHSGADKFIVHKQGECVDYSTNVPSFW